ncbi:MAG TPA: hypothetical protein VH518_14300 [Tepidisphaeraceae bacterium]
MILLWAGLASAEQPATQPALSEKTAHLVADIKAHPSDLRVQILCFDHDQQNMDRSIDVQVTDDEGGAHSAAGLMSAADGAKVVDALAADGFLDRASAPDARPAGRPPQPFYLVFVQFGRDKSLIEARTINASLLDLLVHVRDALGHTAAGKSADAVIVAIDPKRRRWSVAGPASPPKPPALPGGGSSVHPDYTFVPIDPNWKVEESFLKPSHGQFATSFKRIDAEDDFTGLFRDLEYLKGDDQREAKHVICYPSGAVYSETDPHLYGVDLPRGDAYERIFDPAGKLIYYSHIKDGLETDAISIGDQTQRVVNGHGTIHRPTFDANVYSLQWYERGLLIVEESFEGGTCVSTKLRTFAASGGGRHLIIGADHSETMYEGDFEWHRNPSGEVTRRSLYRTDPPASQPAELIDHYRQVRHDFDVQMLASLKAAGYSPREMGIDGLLVP